MSTTRKLWLGLAALLVASFAVLLWVGKEVHQQAPPLPTAVVTADGQTLYTRGDMEEGRQVWQSIGGQQLGSIWGHGALLAPDWSADWLHRESMAMLELLSRDAGLGPYDTLTAQQQAPLKARVQEELRTNTWDAANNTITVSALRARAMEAVAAHYMSLLGNDPATHKLREGYAMRENTVAEMEHRREVTAFFWWTSWAAATQRPNEPMSYTQNWPYEPLAGNTPTSTSFLWSVFSILFMIFGIGLLGWHHARQVSHEPLPVVPARDPLTEFKATPSMKATGKYFWTVLGLFLAQILLGATTAHYQVEGQQAYGFALANYLPYSLTRTWHTELAVLWIATAWLATGLYIAPLISGHEPKFQRLGVNFLWVCLLVIVVGSFAGQWFAVMDKMGLKYNFWFGHQGWEYTDIGRFWQIFLFIGLMLWLFLVGRALWPAMNRNKEGASIVGLLFLSTVAIGLLYGAGLMWGEHTHIAMVEYWRWWVVHLWVEGFFEVFATAVISYLFVRLGLLRVTTATTNVLFATIVFMAGGVLGTLHHLYFSGTTTAVIALGASFSALEVVPLALIGMEAYDTWKKQHEAPWMARYRWPIMFFVAVSFWNLVGAGLLGFLVNTPIALYYMQGLNLTATHGHTALFGVYGMLGLGLMLFCLRGIKPDAEWREGWLKSSFWLLNIGLSLMAALTLLPLGILQLKAVLGHGYWFARSAEFMDRPLIHMLVWMRVPGDTLFAIGALLISVFVAALWLFPKRRTATATSPRAIRNNA
ncbi:nitric-oxide reductase large subunit [Rhodanobacter sp. FDAARGOS 1247]|uniref:nitric-oxide reductase large subunit n=1 Tax=Rhodanobacter sp. FDAARGOS 1247 TaxID=2778082 RepID=UPI00194FB46C|nr:nitric-oxide reductase large subunit [Rhodanobacter sp. FDAARGOS 1247]QRP62929.1 nitric-oxide reductase large subunit [Rhodanobacter sp. FDAARGOS 1247]